jgi:hypothetical protein
MTISINEAKTTNESNLFHALIQNPLQPKAINLSNDSSTNIPVKK